MKRTGNILFYLGLSLLILTFAVDEFLIVIDELIYTLLLVASGVAIGIGYFLKRKQPDNPAPDGILDSPSIEADTSNLSQGQRIDGDNGRFSDGQGRFGTTRFYLTHPDHVAFEKSQAVTDDQRYVLAFGALLLSVNYESAKTLESLEVKLSPTQTLANFGDTLSNWWGIQTREQAIEALEGLSTASTHSPRTDEVFVNFYRKGVYVLPKETSTDALIDLLPATWQWAMDEARHLLKNQEASTSRRELDALIIQEAVNGFHQRAFMSGQDYQRNHKFLLSIGYTEVELANINTLMAWDYGRTGMIAKFSYHLGFITAEEAWAYLTTAATHASQHYISFRQFNAAYCLGRGVAFGGDLADYNEPLNFLLNDSRSPWEEKETPFRPTSPTKVTTTKHEGWQVL